MLSPVDFISGPSALFTPWNLLNENTGCLIAYPFNCGLNLKSVTYEEGVMASNKLFDLNPIPDGIFAAGDIIAVSAVQTAKKRGIKVPEDIAVIGFSNCDCNSPTQVTEQIALLTKKMLKE